MKKKNIIFAILIVIFIGIVFTIINLKNSGVFGQGDKKLPIYCVNTEEKKIAISFDTNWGSDNTKKILDILDKENVKATFFLIGAWVDKYPEYTKEIYKRGHEIGNHSDTHPDFAVISRNKMIQEIAITDAKLMKLIGKATDIFRFPSGSYNENAVNVVESTNHFCIQWDVDSVDWKEYGEDIEYNKVMKKVKPGSILLFHNNAKYTPRTLPRIIKDLKAEGYKFVKISDIIYKKNYYIDYNGKQNIK